jgi:KDO2-lipid IV(A) lauroyltransferase
MRYRLKHRIEYGLLRAVGGLANLLPYRAALGMGSALARAGFALQGRRVRRAMRRVRQALDPGLSEVEVRDIVRRAWRHFALNVIEDLRTPLLTVEWVDEHVDHRELQNVFGAMKDGHGAVLAAPHMGNWELAGIAAQAKGLRIMTIARGQRNPLVSSYINALRKSTGVEVYLHDARSFAGILRRLKEGRVFALLTDLRAKGDWVKVNYLGRDAKIPTGAAHFARSAGVPLLPCYALREGPDHHVWKTFPPIWPDRALSRDDDVHRMTQYMMDCFTQAVRAHPDQYFWFNRRWVLGED